MCKNALILLLAFAGSLATAAERPNILWIFSEDLSPYMGCYDDPINKGHTPSIDRLAADGVLFRRAFMPAPVCSAARSAIITGVMQTTTGTHQHRSSRTTDGEIVPEDTRILLPEGMKTIPELMREAGYFTFNTGKDDYNFHYNRRDLYSYGTKENYEPGMNGWQGNFAQTEVRRTYVENTWTKRPDKEQPWFGQIMIWAERRETATCGKAKSSRMRMCRFHRIFPTPPPTAKSGPPTTTLPVGPMPRSKKFSRCWKLTANWRTRSFSSFRIL